MDDDRYRGAPAQPLNWPPPPPPISAESLEIERHVVTDPISKQVETRYVRKGTTDEVGIPRTYHHQGAAGGFDPPPVQVAVLEAEQILASSLEPPPS